MATLTIYTDDTDSLSIPDNLFAVSVETGSNRPSDFDIYERWPSVVIKMLAIPIGIRIFLTLFNFNRCIIFLNFGKE